MFNRNSVFPVLLSVLFAGSAWAEATPAECQEALQTFAGLGNVKELMDESYGYAVLPTIGKGGMGVGGAAGSGCVYALGKQTGTVKMGQISIGLQLGGEAYSELILLQNQDAYNDFTQGEFEFGAQAQAVALTAGAQASASTKGASASAGTSEEKSGGAAAGFSNGMAVFTVAKGGLMYEASVSGQKFKYEAL